MCRVFFFKQKTAYEMRISDWSSDVCSSDLMAWIENRNNGGSGRYNPYDSFSNSPNNKDFVNGNLQPLSEIRDIAYFETRSEARRVGKECVSKCRSRWSPYH